MPSFNAGSVVDPLDYDFTAFNGSKGVIAEPTDAQVGDFMQGLRDLLKEAREITGAAGIDMSQATIEDLGVALDQLDSEMYQDFNRKQGRLHAGLCGAQPTYEDIMAVPVRIRNLFFAWLQQNVMNPEVKSSGGKAPTPLRKATA